MKIFDCNCSFGVSSLPALKYARTAKELVSEMDFCGIDRALVYHAGQRFSSPSFWNRQILKEVENIPRLNPAWVILPFQTGEQPEPKRFLELMEGKTVKALWAFPDEHRYQLDRCTFGPLLEVLTEKRIPLFAKVNLLTIGNLLGEFPNLTLVAVNQGPHSLERYLRPLVEGYPNFYVDTSYYLVDGLIENFCRKYGSKRLLFGSGFPDNCSGGALLRLVRAEIDEEAKKDIAGRNLESMLSKSRL